jgi:ribosomal protein L31
MEFVDFVVFDVALHNWVIVSCVWRQCIDLIFSSRNIQEESTQICSMRHPYYTKKCRILNTYKTFKTSLQHVSAPYIPSSGSVISHILKPATNGVCSCHRRYGVRCCCL